MTNPTNPPTPDGRPHLALRRWLRSQPMTRAELAARLGYEKSHVYHVVGGSKPLTPNFRGRFLDEFGATATAAAFPETADVAVTEAAGAPLTAEGGGSAVGCCPKCGAPWTRIVATPDMTDRPRRSAAAKTAALNGQWSGTSSVGQAYQEWRNANPNVTTAWRPTCLCSGLDGDAPWPDLTMHPDGPANWPTVPCVILDPFVGSGTTLLVAQEPAAPASASTCARSTAL